LGEKVKDFCRDIQSCHGDRFKTLVNIYETIRCFIRTREITFHPLLKLPMLKPFLDFQEVPAILPNCLRSPGLYRKLFSLCKLISCNLYNYLLMKIPLKENYNREGLMMKDTGQGAPGDKKISPARVITGGIVILGICKLAIPALLKVFTATSHPKINSLLLFCEGDIWWVGLTILIIGLALLFFPPILANIWEKSFLPELDKFNHSVEKHLEIVSNKMHVIGEDFDKYIKKRGGPLIFDNCKTDLDFEQYIEPACRELYGVHSLNPQSLYQFVRTRLLNPYCLEPLRSNVRKRIHLRPCSNLADYIDSQHASDYVEWIEDTEYETNNILYKTKKVTSYFDINFTVSSHAPEFDQESWFRAASIDVEVNGRKILSKDNIPTYEENIIDEGFHCWKDGNWIFLHFRKHLELTDPRTKILIHEKSLNSRKDKTYSLNIARPVYRHFVDITLPSEYAFSKNPYFSPNIVHDGLPGHIKKDFNVDKSLQHRFPSDNQLIVDINEWILPGIILTVDWYKVPSSGERE
jgi:hypothetical protein